MINPVRSEREAFRFLIYVAAFFVVVVGAILIIRAL
jgi:hypothetical protein